MPIYKGMIKSKITVLARDYYWECGDGCCQESKKSYELIEDRDRFCVDTIYVSPMPTKESFIFEQKIQNNSVLLEALKERLKDEVKIPENITLVELLELIDFSFEFTTDEYDY